MEVKFNEEAIFTSRKKPGKDESGWDDESSLFRDVNWVVDVQREERSGTFQIVFLGGVRTILAHRTGWIIELRAASLFPIWISLIPRLRCACTIVHGSCVCLGSHPNWITLFLNRWNPFSGKNSDRYLKRDFLRTQIFPKCHRIPFCPVAKSLNEMNDGYRPGVHDLF